jgi:hypothetical protein
MPKAFERVVANVSQRQTADVRQQATGRQVSYLRADPPLLWRRCDAVAALSLAGLAALAVLAWPAVLIGVPMALLYAPLLVSARLAWRYLTRAQGDRVLDMVKGRELAQPFLRRVK